VVGKIPEIFVLRTSTSIVKVPSLDAACDRAEIGVAPDLSETEPAAIFDLLDCVLVILLIADKPGRAVACIFDICNLQLGTV
jgi:hypothetical protein